MTKALTPEQELEATISSFAFDPYGYVLFSYPWGEGPLVGEDGPDKWQTRALKKLGRLCKKQGAASAVRLAVRSGHGVGKTAFAAWVIDWFIKTRPMSEAVVTANTTAQLEHKTWRELGKWHGMSITKHWAKHTATTFRMNADKAWLAMAQPWSSERSEAFAGTHEKHVLLVFDEASAIDDSVWDVAEGAMTTEGAMWVVLGNPTKNTGRFRECWGKFRHRWETFTVDSRDAKQASPTQIQAWKDDYGEDSDFFKVRVRGEFPSASSRQFIPTDVVEKAQKRKAQGYENQPIILGVDVARQGSDMTVFQRRQGRKAFKPRKFTGLELTDIAGFVMEEIRNIEEETGDYPAAVNIDATGLGWGLVDTLKERGYIANPVQTAERASEPHKYANTRVELWGLMREWLKGGDIPKDSEALKDDLIGPEYDFTKKDQFLLESKRSMKSRGLQSPDEADALALTFAVDVIGYDHATSVDDALPEISSWMAA